MHLCFQLHTSLVINLKTILYSLKKKKVYADAKERQLIYNLYHMLYELRDPNSGALIFVNRIKFLPN